MKSFKDFGITTASKPFIGDKIRISKILNREITVNDFRIADSKFEGKGLCLCLQITVGETKNIVFTGSKYLMEMIEKVPKSEFPFTTTIVEEDERYEFT